MSGRGAAEMIDPITLEIQWQRFIALIDEIDTATIRTSFSTIVRDSYDFLCGANWIRMAPASRR